MITWRLACCRVDYAERGGTSEPRLDDISRAAFTRLERAYSARRVGLDGWSGRLAAKRAIAEVIGLDWRDASVLRKIEVLPRPRIPCVDPLRCDRGHPPAARVADDLDLPFLRESHGRLIGIDVSISHESGTALAAALAVVSRAGK
jgi:phosphopantetheinyl transferase (holo-ACP synthase)